LLNRKVIAQNITNLTDARYFAAWGVDYISFNTIPDSPFFLTTEKLLEIKEWVEGPQFLLETNALEMEEIADGFILSNIYSSLPIVKESFFRITFEDIQKGLPPGKYISPIDSAGINYLKQQASDELLGIDLYFDVSSLNIEEISQLENFGIVIQGGEEEKVGVKSFDDLDEIYELLMD